MGFVPTGINFLCHLEDCRKPLRYLDPGGEEEPSIWICGGGHKNIIDLSLKFGDRIFIIPEIEIKCSEVVEPIAPRIVSSLPEHCVGCGAKLDTRNASKVTGTAQCGNCGIWYVFNGTHKQWEEALSAL